MYVGFFSSLSKLKNIDALDAFVEVAKTRRVGPNKMKDDPFARVLAAEVKASIEEMKLTMIRNFDAMMECCRTGEPIPVEDRVRYRYDSAVVADRCLALSSRMLKAAGSGGVRQGSDLLADKYNTGRVHLLENGEPLSVEGSQTAELARRAMEILGGRPSDRPFFLLFAPTDTHAPFENQLLAFTPAGNSRGSEDLLEPFAPGIGWRSGRCSLTS